jgi:UDP-N-acetylmuramoyl-L-alanyl-D-glutamate--2,6-diaminopimelate ligase
MSAYFVKNSKEIKPGNVFVSIKGLKTNGNNYIIEAVENGASKIIVQMDNPVSQDIISYLLVKNIPLEYVEDVYYAFANNIKKKYENVFSHITFIGVTGTKGKTSTCNALFNLLRADGHSVALMSTAFHKINDVIEKAELTTEMINFIYNFLKKAISANVTHVILEVSAQAFTQYRIYGILFDAFIFTNFSQEHSESYKTQEEYFLAKCQLYNYLKPNAIVLLNQEDEKVLSSIHYTKNRNFILKTFSSQLEDKSDIYYTIQSDSINMTKATLYYKKNTYLFNSSWLGIYNIANIACALLVLDELLFLNQQKIIFLLKQVEYFENIPGRNEKYFLSQGKTVCIEKACTPNSVELTLKLLKSLTHNLIVVFGCGGERDTKKRPLLANIVESFAQTIYVSTDNPRNEPLEKIFKDIANGFSFTKDIYFIKDRKKAIELAIENAPSESIIVLLGKGDEQYQNIQNQLHYFSEKEIIERYMK